MFKINSIFKIVIVVFLCLVIPSFITIFKLSFDGYLATQNSEVKGLSTRRTGKELDFDAEQIVAASNQPFVFTYSGVQNGVIHFYNNNSFELDNVTITLVWKQGLHEFSSTYTTSEIEAKSAFYKNLGQTSSASVPFNLAGVIKSIVVNYTDKTGRIFTNTL